MTSLETRTPNFPEHPEDGFEIIEYLDDGRELHWVYNKELNQWAAHFIYPESPATEGWVLSQGYVQGPVMTRDVLTTPGDSILEVLKNADPTEEPPSPALDTQEQVNNIVAAASAKILAKGQRTQLNVDFLQNTLDGGYWVHKDREQEAELPGPATFFALTKSGENAENFDDAYQFIFNSTGIDSSQQLDYACQGTTLFLADVSEGGYGLYVITGVEQLGNPEGGQFICTFDVVVQRGKAGGPIRFNSHVEMKVMSPAPVLVQGEEPFVDDFGYLWYNPGTKELSVSEWHSGDTPGSSDVVWTKYSPGGGGGEGGDYLPLTGGTIDGMLTIDKGPLMVNGAQVVELPTGGDLFTVLGSDNGDAIFVINGAGSGKYLGKQNVPENIATVGHVSDKYLPLAGGTMSGDLIMNGKKITGLGSATQGGMAVSRNYGDERYLQLAAGGKITGYVQFQDDTKLQMGGTYNNNIIDGKEGFTDNSIVATLGFVNHAIANSSVGGLSPREKMYLQGFYPFEVSDSTSMRPGRIVFTNWNYLLELNPENWKYIKYSVVDAYGQDLAGTFMNHMDTRNLESDDQRAQVWFARENGAKLCSFVGSMPLSDNNFEDRSDLTFNSDCTLLNPPNYDTASLRVDAGEILWIKHSRWG